MFRSFIRNRLSKVERETGTPTRWLSHMVDHSPTAFFKFLLFLPMASHRGAASREALAVARLVATREEDCGPCLQTVVDQSLQAGVRPELVRLVVAGRVEELEEELALVYRYAVAVCGRDPETDRWTERVVERMGRAVLVDLGLAVASVPVFTRFKRATGFAGPCALVDVAGEPVSPGKAA